MKAISIRQPWAWAIFHAGKDIENRAYKCSKETIAIHCALKKEDVKYLPAGARKPKDEDLLTGVIIGVVDVVDVVEHHKSKWFVGPFGWILKNPRLLSNPIPCAGAQRLWKVPPAKLRAIKRQVSGL